MICPKCGRNIEGNLCPYCEAPQIDDNTDEYLRRKSAYEESLEKKEPHEEEKPKGRRLTKKAVITILAVIGGALTVALVTTHLPKVYTGKLYTVNGDSVSEAADNGDFLSVDGKIYSSEGKNVYAKITEPDGIGSVEDSQIKGYSVSSNGKYAALAVLDAGEDEGYSLFVWDDEGHSTKALSQKDMISVKDVTDTGEIIFTSSPVLNDQWYTGDSSLHVYRITEIAGDGIKGETKRIGEDLQNFYIYEKIKSIICLEKDGTLFSCPGYDPEKRVVLTEKVTDLMAEKGDENDHFAPDAAGVNIYRTADLITYRREGVWIMSDTEGRISLTLGAAGGDTRFVYDDPDHMIYRYEAGILSKSIVSDKGLTEWETVIGTAEDDLIWNASGHTLICGTTDGNLMRVTGTQASSVTEDFGKGSLKKVQNSDSYIFKTSDGMYAGRDFSSNPDLIEGDIDADIHTCAGRKGIIYLYAGNRLYEVHKNNKLSETGDCGGLFVVE